VTFKVTSTCLSFLVLLSRFYAAANPGSCKWPLSTHMPNLQPIMRPWIFCRVREKVVILFLIKKIQTRSYLLIYLRNRFTLLYVRPLLNAQINHYSSTTWNLFKQRNALLPWQPIQFFVPSRNTVIQEGGCTSELTTKWLMYPRQNMAGASYDLLFLTM
jgi:hypothetical protein